MAWQQPPLPGNYPPGLDSNVMHYGPPPHQQQQSITMDNNPYPNFIMPYPQNPDVNNQPQQIGMAFMPSVYHPIQLPPTPQISPPMDMMSPTMPLASQMTPTVQPMNAATAISNKSVFNKFNNNYTSAQAGKCPTCGCDPAEVRLVLEKNEILESEIYNLRQIVEKSRVLAQTPVDQKLSKLSPDAAEFRPDEASNVNSSTDVPVVSAKVIAEEPSEEVASKTVPEETSPDESPPQDDPTNNDSSEDPSTAPQKLDDMIENKETIAELIDVAENSATSEPVQDVVSRATPVSHDWCEEQEVEAIPQVDNSCQTVEEGIEQEESNLNCGGEDKPFGNSLENRRNHHRQYQPHNNYHQHQQPPRYRHGRGHDNNTSGSNNTWHNNAGGRVRFGGNNFRPPNPSGGSFHNGPRMPMQYQHQYSIGPRGEGGPGRGGRHYPQDGYGSRRGSRENVNFNRDRETHTNMRSQDSTFNTSAQDDDYNHKYGENRGKRHDNRGKYPSRQHSLNSQESTTEVNWTDPPNQSSQLNQPVENWRSNSKEPKEERAHISGVQDHEIRKKPSNSNNRDYLTEAKEKRPETGGIRSGERERPDRFRTNNRESFRHTFKEVKADLFSAPNDFSLAHCVAKDFQMGRGIAVKFKSDFRRVPQLLNQNVNVGGCAFLEDNQRYIFYLVTKEVSNGKPTYDTLRSSLIAMKGLCQKFGVTKVALPRIGCGLDKLLWNQVRPMINEVFSDMDICVTVYDFNTDGVPEHEGNKSVPSGLKVVHKIMPLVDMEIETALIFFGTEDGYLDSTAESLDKKFHFGNEYKRASKTVGKMWFPEKLKSEYWVCCLIVSKSYCKDKLDYTTLDSCIREMYKYLKQQHVKYIAFEALKEWSSDPVTSEKVVSLMRIVIHRPVDQLWVCYPTEDDDPFKFAAEKRT